MVLKYTTIHSDICHQWHRLCCEMYADVLLTATSRMYTVGQCEHLIRGFRTTWVFLLPTIRWLSSTQYFLRHTLSASQTCVPIKYNWAEILAHSWDLCPVKFQATWTRMQIWIPGFVPDVYMNSAFLHFRSLAMLAIGVYYICWKLCTHFTSETQRLVLLLNRCIWLQWPHV